ncbi:hypothetical protein [Halopelagius fulvigenes]|uniref:HTH domain-containing protein n=1 Tax=Halopelagius fulvigenes TaxID=1198324 RepID=A0ABD5U1E2_9EURY
MEKRLLDEMDICEPYTASELAETLDAERRTVHNYLEALAEEDKIHRKKHTSRHVSWWRTE